MTSAESALCGELADLDDQELACRTQVGSSSCFAELVGRYENRLLRFLLRRAGRHDAEDLLQETFARAYQRIDSYKPDWPFRTWLFTIASRLAVSHYRKKRQTPLGDTQHLRSTADDPADLAAEREQAENLWALAGRALSDDQYTALYLRYGEGMSIKEISRATSKRATHVRVLLFRARSSLGRRLAGPAPAAAGRAATLAGGPHRQHECGRSDLSCSKGGD